MAIRHEIRVGERTVVAHDAGGDGLAVIWHHGSPQTGALLEPLVSSAAQRGVRIISYARPSYGGSTPNPERTVASAAADVTAVADALGVGRFATMGASGGGPHALACGALLPDRVTAVACFAALAPFTGNAEWFDGMVAPDGLRTARNGRDARLEFADVDEFDAASFVEADWEVLIEDWRSLGDDVSLADAAGPEGLVDDDVAFVRPWGFDLGQVNVPVLLAQGARDRVVPAAHAEWLARHCPQAELWVRPLDGHVSILMTVPDALDWLIARSA